LAAVKIEVPPLCSSGTLPSGEEARGQVGTEWPTPADLSALYPVCLNKSREVKRGIFGEGMMRPGRVCMQRQFGVCVRDTGRVRKRDGGTEDDKKERTGWYC